MVGDKILVKKERPSCMSLNFGVVGDKILVKFLGGVTKVCSNSKKILWTFVIYFWNKIEFDQNVEKIFFCDFCVLVKTC